MSWTIDSRCSRCCKKKDCADRLELNTTLSPLTNKLNMEEPFASGSGDGIIIVTCHDFAVAE